MYKRKTVIFLLLSLYLGLHNGYLALWEAHSALPKTVYPYHFSTYPKLDQDALKAGVQIETDNQLQALLDDLTS